MFMASKLRRGHDFHKDKGGEIAKPWAMRKPMCHLSLFYPTTTIEIWCWWLRQLLFWEWCGRTASPFPHTHSTCSWLHNGKETTTINPSFYSPSTTVLKRSRTLHYAGLTICCPSSRRSGSCSRSRTSGYGAFLQFPADYSHAQDGLPT